VDRRSLLLNLNRNILLGFGLLLGGLIITIGLVILVMGFYLAEMISLLGAILITLAALLLLVVPQVWLGVYLLRIEFQQNR